VSMKARVKKLEAKSGDNFSVTWPTAYQKDGTECRVLDEVAYLVFRNDPPLRFDRHEGEGLWEFDARANELAKEVIKSTFVLPWWAIDI
jgi:hypothetical protein